MPRWTGFSGDLKFTELHGFSDVSERAHAACIYLRIVNAVGNVQSILLVSNSKVASLKQVSASIRALWYLAARTIYEASAGHTLSTGCHLLFVVRFNGHTVMDTRTPYLMKDLRGQPSFRNLNYPTASLLASCLEQGQSCRSRFSRCLSSRTHWVVSVVSWTTVFTRFGFSMGSREWPSCAGRLPRETQRSPTFSDDTAL